MPLPFDEDAGRAFAAAKAHLDACYRADFSRERSEVGTVFGPPARCSERQRALRESHGQRIVLRAAADRGAQYERVLGEVLPAVLA